jgi:predicted transcriptional regulator
LVSTFESEYGSQENLHRAFNDKRGKDVAILKSPPRPPKNEMLQIRVEEEIKAKLHKYAEFIDSSESYVVSEALKLLFRKDVEFKTWLEEQPQNGNQPQNAERPRLKIGSET